MTDHKHDHVQLASAEGTATCPVCQMDLSIAPETVSIEHEGETFYFCNEDCRDEFEEGPSAFIR